MALSVLMAVAVVLTVPLSRRAADGATAKAATEATSTAQLSLAPLLVQADLEAPVTGDRYNELSSGIREHITVPGPIEHVILWSSSGQVLYDDDQVRVGGSDASLTSALQQVADGGPLSRIQGGVLETFVPLWLEADGPVAVAQLDRPVDPITAGATQPWRLATIGLAALLVIAVLQTLRTLRRRPAEVTPEPEDAPTPPTARAIARMSGTTDGPATPASPAGPPPTGTVRRRPGRAPGGDGELPLYAQAGFREIQEARQEAERRARTAEERFHELQERFRLVASTEAELQDARARIRELEAEVARLRAGSEHVVLETGAESPRVILRPAARPEEVLPITERRG
jgi:hypothetical protein